MNAPVSPFARLGNRRTVRLDQIPESAIESFRDAIVTAVDEGWRIVSLFGTPETATSVRLIVVVADDERGQLGAASTVVGDRYPSIAGVCAQASVLEREIAEQCGSAPPSSTGSSTVRLGRAGIVSARRLSVLSTRRR
jgi:hypothetical protein